MSDVCNVTFGGVIRCEIKQGSNCAGLTADVAHLRRCDFDEMSAIAKHIRFTESNSHIHNQHRCVQTLISL